MDEGLGTFHNKRFLGMRIPRYAAPMTQIVLVGFIMFLNPGMYNALAGLGGAGQVDATVQNHAGIGLHSAFAVFGLIAGTVHNVLCVSPKCRCFSPSPLSMCRRLTKTL